ncbi:integrase [Methylophilus luteus]|uniref:Integrase n=1 Tax=Methylophilus luteus TaxID=640108 RepID=A0ABW3F5X0_9PROT
MKNITKRGKYSYRVRVYVNGSTETETFDTLKDAQIWRDMKKARIALDPDKQQISNARIKQREAKSSTLLKAIERYEKEVTPKKKGAKVELTRTNKLKKTSIAKKSIYAIHPSDVLEVLDEIGFSENNKRKYASLISHIFKTAKQEWRMNVHNPVAGEITLPSNGKARDRRLKEGELEQLEKLLTGQLKQYLRLAIETGMRRSELLNLTWDQVDLKKVTIWLTDTKNGESRAVPLSTKARLALEELKGLDKTKIFTMTPFQLRKGWEKVRTQLNLGDLRIHDLRHEATSRFFEKGLNVIEAASITGHKSLTMLKRYTHLNPTDLAKKLD